MNNYFNATLTNLKNNKVIACMAVKGTYYGERAFEVNSGPVSFNILEVTLNGMYLLTDLESDQKYFVKVERAPDEVCIHTGGLYFREVSNNLEIVKNIYEEMYHGIV